MKRGLFIAVLIPLVFGVGCAQNKQVRVTYRSDPPGGRLHNLDGELCGPCPKVVWYDLDEEDISAGYMEIKGMIMRWPSGPEKTSGEIITITIDGSDRQVTFVQPGSQADTAVTHTEAGQ